jgi:hypothetical protein
MTFIEAKNRKELRTKINKNDYAVIKKTCGGYICFDSNNQYQTWKNQK